MEAVESIAQLQNESWVANRDTALLVLVYGSGLRIGEALSLRRKDIGSGDALRVVGKGSKERQVPLLPVVKEALETILN